jgi:phage baseplate assembly protein V
MIGAINNAMRLQALRAVGTKTHSRLGIITGYDPNKYSVKVSLQPEGIATGFIRFAAAWVGNGWGLFAPPSINDPVSVIFIDGELTASYAECCFFNNALVPLAVPSGELWIVHALGQSVKFTNDGKLSLNDGHGASAVLNGDGTITSAASKWTHTGEMDISGTVNITGTTNITGNATVSQTLTATTDVVGGGKSLKTHQHTLTQPGTGDSGPPL